MRWDFVFQLFGDNKEAMKHSTLSALLVSDKQDPALVGEITSLYKWFIKTGFYALGLYLKAIQFLTECFYDKTLTPEVKIYRAWWAKTFFVIWHENVPSPEMFISIQTFYDVLCCCDGIILYMITLKRYFPDAYILPHFFTSDPCELAFAFVRIGRYNGRRTNIDCITLCDGLAARNKTFEMSARILDDDQCAHTRGKRILKHVVPTHDELMLSGTDDVEQLHKGKSINEQRLQNVMKKATRDCIDECKSLELDFFENALPDKELMNTDSERHIRFCEEVPVHHYSSDVSEEEDDFEPTFDGTDDENEIDEDGVYIDTSMGNMHLQTAEKLFLNGGGLSNLGKSRSNRVKTKLVKFNKNAYKDFLTKPACCDEAIKKGALVRLPTFKDNGKFVQGHVRFVSVAHTPVNFACKTHQGDANLWLWDGESYVRCTLKK